MNRLIFLFVTAFFIFMQPAHAREQFLEIKNVTSPGGISAWLVEDHSIPVISLQFSFKGMGASLDPAEKQGLSRMLSNTMDEGAGPLDSQAFQKELRDLVIDLYFNSSRDQFGGTLKTLSTNKRNAFALLQMALTSPRFDQESIERMRESNKSRIRRSLSDPEWISARIMNDVAFAGHPYAQNSGGTLSTLSNINADDLRTRAKQLSRDRLFIAASGDITASELGVMLDEIFGGLPETANTPVTPDATLQNTGKTYVHQKDIPQTIIDISQQGIDRKDPRYHTAQVMNFILGSSGFGSRLTAEIREKRGLTYGIYSNFLDLDHIDTLNVSTSTRNESVPEMLGLIKAEWDKMKTTPVTPKELADAKSYLIGALPLSLSSTDKISSMLLSLQLDGLPIDYLDQREKNIMAVTAEDIRKLANELLDTSSFVTVLVGNPPRADNMISVTEINNVE